MTILRILPMFLLALPLCAQMSEQDVRARLDLIHSGKADEVRSEIPALQRQFPGDPGVQYLDAYLTGNGDQAVKKYQAIVDRSPKNEWADDALYKVYQYYYAVGLYKTADAKLQQLNDDYPSSIYSKRPVNLNEKTEVSQPAQEQPAEIQKAEPVQQATPSAAGPYAVQVGVYSQERTAEQQARQLTSTIGRTAIVFAKTSAGKTVYAVAFEGFSGDAEARVFGAELKSKYDLDWFVVKR